MTAALRRLGPPALGLAVYAALEAQAFARFQDWINPDAVCYLRNASYWSEGRIGDAISGYWSPLLSWCVAPLAALGMDPLHALYLALGLWGAALVLAAHFLSERLGPVPPWLRAAGLVLVAESTVTWSATAFPDVILAACLTAYAAAALAPGLFDRRAPAVAAGLLAGLGYLGKAYGFPFFLVHWPATVALLAWVRGVPPRRAAATGLLGLLGFAALALPWVLALSWKFETPTYSLVGRINHAIVGPDDQERNELWEPVPGRVTGWEIPETRRYRDWSPLESASAFRHQVSYAWTTLKEVRGSLARFDYLSLGLAVAALGPLLLLAMGVPRRETEGAFFTTTTVALYALPFCLVYFTYRYTGPFLRPLLILASVRLAWVAATRLRTLPWPGPRARALLGGAGVALVLCSFAAHANIPFRPHTLEEPDGTPFDNITVDSRPHRAAAAELRAAGAAGPLAATRYWGGMYLGYFLDAPFVGTPMGATADACERELRAVGVRTFLVHRGWPHEAAFSRLPGWRRAVTLRTPSGEVLDAWVRP